MIQWTEPKYLGINWDTLELGQIVAQPATIISAEAMRRLHYAGHETLKHINFHQQRIVPRGDLFRVNYYMYWSYAVAVASLYTALHLVDCEESPIGKALLSEGDYFSDRGVLTPLSAYDVKPDGPSWRLDQMGYAYVYLRVGCTHPNLKVWWEAMHDKRTECPDCGFGARYDTSG